MIGPPEPCPPSIITLLRFPGGQRCFEQLVRTRKSFHGSGASICRHMPTLVYARLLRGDVSRLSQCYCCVVKANPWMGLGWSCSHFMIERNRLAANGCDS